MDVVHLNQKQLAARWCISEATPERWRPYRIAATLNSYPTITKSPAFNAGCELLPNTANCTAASPFKPSAS